jgi:hypothetical protein
MQLTNAPFILSELAAALDKLIREGEPSTINLSRVPMTEEDATFLGEFLGKGATFIDMEGVSCTHFRESSYAGVWCGEYYSAPGQISLRTLEVAEVPELVLATKEDMAEGLSRLMDDLPGFGGGENGTCTKPE